MAMFPENPRLRSNSEDGSSGWRQVAIKWMLQTWTFRGVGNYFAGIRTCKATESFQRVPVSANGISPATSRSEPPQ